MPYLCSPAASFSLPRPACSSHCPTHTAHRGCRPARTVRRAMVTIELCFPDFSGFLVIVIGSAISYHTCRTVVVSFV
ncbi:hypothetical protein C8R47DRAFT_1054815 [Mycena vitilis]|nr:hypothetical protein C8R47DRAFT_1054815 [Mycena vitilis]